MGDSRSGNYSLAWLTVLLDHRGKDSPQEVRSVLLVVATLIAAVTFQAGVNPPGGVWQDGENAGRAIYARDQIAFYVFLSCNTLALSSSILLIISHTWGFPFFLEVVIATMSMVLTYGASIFAITPKEVQFRFLLFIAAGPIIARVVIQLCKYVNRRLNKKTCNSDSGTKQEQGAKASANPEAAC